MNNKTEILQLIEEIENWNVGDHMTFIEHGEVTFDGAFVFKARQKKINELKKLLDN